MEPGTWVAIFIAVFGGAGLKIVESVLGRRERKVSHEEKFRDELRQEIERLKKRADDAEEDADKWRDRYYKLQDERELHDASDQNL